MMVADGVPDIIRLAGGTVNALGAAPKLHCKTAPVAINIGIQIPSYACSCPAPGFLAAGLPAALGG